LTCSGEKSKLEDAGMSAGGDDVQETVRARLDRTWARTECIRLDVQRFRGGLVFKARILLYQSTCGVRVMKKTIHNPP